MLTKLEKTFIATMDESATFFSPQVAIFVLVALSHGLKYDVIKDATDKQPGCKGRKSQSKTTCSEVADDECDGTWIEHADSILQCKLTKSGCLSTGPLCKPVVGPGIGKDGIVAWYRSEDAEPVWKSKVGSLEAKATHGSVEVKVEKGNGAGKPVKYIYGNTNAYYDFGPILKKGFTICSVSRYAGGHTNRVLQASGMNWLHGHWSSRTGVAHYQTWNTPHSGPNNKEWLVYCGTSGKRVMNGAGKNIANNKANDLTRDYNLVVNTPGERSEFGVMEVIVWNKHLSEDDMEKVVEYLNAKLEHGSS